VLETARGALRRIHIGRCGRLVRKEHIMAIPTSIAEFLSTHGIHYGTVTHPVAYTAQEEAAVSHVPGKTWAKTVVCLANDEPIQVVLPAHLAVDAERLKGLAGSAELRLAREDEFERLYPECERGAMPPLGPLYGQRVFVDSHLTGGEEIVFNAGTHTDAIRMRYADFAALVHPTIGEFCRRV
jgi:Ala-tRNA(Pro) deacylase